MVKLLINNPDSLFIKVYAGFIAKEIAVLWILFQFLIRLSSHVIKNWLLLRPADEY